MIAVCLTLINFFFIPTISLYSYYILKRTEIKFSFSILLQYMVFTCLDIVFAKSILVPIKFFLSVNLLMTGGAYTCVAIPIALLSAFLIVFLKKYCSISIKKITGDSDEKE